jgi:hypothetical protein
VPREERDREIAAAYEWAYLREPQAPWLGELGLGLLAAAVAVDRRRHDSA